MKHHNIAIIGQGQDFDLIVAIERRYVEDGYLRTEEVALSSCTDLSVKVVTYSHKEVDFTWSYNAATNRIQISLSSDITEGDYGIEIKGKFSSGRNWRLFAPPGEVFRVVNHTTCANAVIHTDLQEVNYTACIGVSSLAGDTISAMQDITKEASEVVKQGKELIEALSEITVTYDNGYMTLGWPDTNDSED